MGAKSAKAAALAGHQPNSSAPKQAIGSEEYAWWPLESIQSSWRKATELGLEKVSRVQWLEVFSDITVVLQGNRYLMLPLSLFDVFLEPGHKELPVHVQTVFVREVLLIMTLFCRSSPTSQLRFCFEMFDDDNSKTITIDEMVSFFRVLCSAASKVDLLATMPPKALLEEAAASSFRAADVNHDQSISAREFIAWARKNVLTRSLLKEFQLAKKQASKKVDKKQMQILQQRAKVEQKKRRINKRRLKSLNSAMTAAKKLIGKVTKRGDFGLKEIRKLRDIFNSVAGDKAGALSRTEFAAVLGRSFPLIMKEKSLMNELFTAFDTDKSGDVDFREFMLGLAKIIESTFQKKMQMVFEVLDRQGKGYATISDLLDVVKEGSQEMMEIANITEDTIMELDKDGDGTVSLAEFREVLTEKPVLFECFFGKSINTKLEVYREKFKHKRGCSIWALGNLWDRYRHHPRKVMSIMRFRKMMTDEFDCGTREYAPIVTRIFTVVDAHKDGFVPYQDIFSALAQVYPGSTAERATLFFRLYDADGSGEMDKDELLHMVLASRDQMDQTAGNAGRLLLQLDTDGDGVVTWDEFQQAYTNNPDLIRMFGKLFGVDSPIDPDKEQFYSGPVFQITRAITAEQARAFESARKYGGENTEDLFRQDALHHKTGYKWLRRRQQKDNSFALSMMRRSSIQTAAKIVTAMQMVQHETDEEIKQGLRQPDMLMVREQQIAASVAAREFGAMMKNKLKADSFRIMQDIKNLKRRTHAAMNFKPTKHNTSQLPSVAEGDLSPRSIMNWDGLDESGFTSAGSSGVAGAWVARRLSSVGVNPDQLPAGASAANDGASQAASEAAGEAGKPPAAAAGVSELRERRERLGLALCSPLSVAIEARLQERRPVRKEVSPTKAGEGEEGEEQGKEEEQPKRRKSFAYRQAAMELNKARRTLKATKHTQALAEVVSNADRKDELHVEETEAVVHGLLTGTHAREVMERHKSISSPAARDRRRSTPKAADAAAAVLAAGDAHQPPLQKGDSFLDAPVGSAWSESDAHSGSEPAAGGLSISVPQRQQANFADFAKAAVGSLVQGASAGASVNGLSVDTSAPSTAAGVAAGLAGGTSMRRSASTKSPAKQSPMQLRRGPNGSSLAELLPRNLRYVRQNHRTLDLEEAAELQKRATTPKGRRSGKQRLGSPPAKVMRRSKSSAPGSTGTFLPQVSKGSPESPPAAGRLGLRLQLQALGSGGDSPATAGMPTPKPRVALNLGPAEEGEEEGGGRVQAAASPILQPAILGSPSRFLLSRASHRGGVEGLQYHLPTTPDLRPSNHVVVPKPRPKLGDNGQPVQWSSPFVRRLQLPQTSRRRTPRSYHSPVRKAPATARASGGGAQQRGRSHSEGGHSSPAKVRALEAGQTQVRPAVPRIKLRKVSTGPWHAEESPSSTS